MDSDDSHSAKRFRSENGTGVRSGSGDQRESFSHKVCPSQVVHVRNLPEYVAETDIHEAVMNFGTISYIMLIPNKTMGLIEFEDIESATALVTHAQTNTIYVGSKPALFNYSTSTRIKRPMDLGYNCSPNRVILLTILDARHPITVEIIHAITYKFGKVLRIVIFRKNGVQAMVEFESVDAALKAKQELHGQDIYSECCTIKTDFAKPTSLNVKRNDMNTWDFTSPAFAMSDSPREESQMMKNQPLLADPRYSAAPAPFSPMCGGYPGFGQFGMGFTMPGAGYPAGYMSMGNTGCMLGAGGDTGGSQQRGRESRDTKNYQPGVFPSPAALLSAYESQTQVSTSGGNPECVLMVYGLDAAKFNCQRLFNLLCVYGTVIRIKFLKSKEGSAMVQMGDRESCDRVTRNLNGISCFGSKIVISASKQSYLQDVVSPHTLPDGTIAYADYVGCKNQRYSCEDAVSKNRPVQPTSTLYFYNAPPNISEEQIQQAITDAGAFPPTKMCIFPPKSEKSSRGLMQWSRIESCTEALVLANHAQIYGSGGGGHSRAPFVLKLAYSHSTVD